MSSVSVMRELVSAQADPSADEALNMAGVPADVLPFCGAAHIHPRGPFFEFGPQGERAVIIPALDGGEVADLVAYRRGRVWVRLGACPLLGLDNLGVWSEPMHVWRTPLGYLRAGLHGVVVLSWPAAIPLLRSCSELIAEDIEHGNEIRRRLSAPPATPAITVPVARVAA